MGHLRLAEDVRESFSLDRVLFVPTNIPPHKSVKQHVDSVHRCNMVNSALQGNSSFFCEDVELKRGGSSYTVDTAEYVYEHYTFEGKPFFILGSDLVPELHTWKDVERLARLVHFIILVRANYPFISTMCDGIMGLTYSLFERRKIEINSSEIRDLAGAGKSIRYLVAEPVREYIEQHGLYKNKG
jgi:nicotinate-nucleotide adenylyltransferase